jgi:hypothetical protein
MQSLAWDNVDLLSERCAANFANLDVVAAGAQIHRFILMGCAGVGAVCEHLSMTLNGPLVYENFVMQLDDSNAARQMRSVPGGLVVRRCLVKYSGGRIIVPGDYDSVVFQITPKTPPTQSGLRFAREIISNPQSVKASPN